MGKGKKKPPPPPPPIEVDKTFYELQIADIQRRITNLSSATLDLADKNELLEYKTQKLDEDKAELIRNLQKMYQDKVVEVTDLIQKLQELHDFKISDAKNKAIEFTELENTYKLMREKLSSEIKIATGKLKSIEVFRATKEQLFNKFYTQEKQFEKAEQQHKKMMYNLEKKFNTTKDSIKKEMEKLIFDMGLNMEKNNSTKIASSTHRVVRENYIIHSELFNINNSNTRLVNVNNTLKNNKKIILANITSSKNENENTLSNISIQRGVEAKIKQQYEKLTELLKASNILVKRAKNIELQLNNMLALENRLNLDTRILEQNLHASQCHKKKLEEEFQTMQHSLNFHLDIINEVVLTIKTDIKIKIQPDLAKYVTLDQRENLFSVLLKILTRVLKPVPTKSTQTITSSRDIYAKGDLGITPEIHTINMERPMGKDVESQIGLSFESFINRPLLFSEHSSELEDTFMPGESIEVILSSPVGEEEFLSSSVSTAVPSTYSEVTEISKDVDLSSIIDETIVEETHTSTSTTEEIEYEISEQPSYEDMYEQMELEYFDPEQSEKEIL